MTALRDELLAGRTIALSGGDPASALGVRLLGLRATLAELDLPDGLDDQDALERLPGALDGIVHDARPGFGSSGLAAALEGAWRAIAAAANGVLIPSGGGGKIVLIAPPANAGAHAGAARAALENLARTLSVEWARYQITTTAIWPGPAAGDDAVGELVAFLLSPAGDYISGCRFDLGAV